MGNNRPRPPSLYTGAFSAALGNSAWNARPYSFAGSASAIPDYADAQLGITLAGPFKIPGLLRSGPMTRVSYQHGVQHTATSQSARLPTLAERDGNLAGRSAIIRDPLTQLPFAGNVIPRDRIAPQASALLAYYPHPGEVTDRGANYERPLLGDTTTDTVQVGMQHAVTVRTQLAGTFAYERPAWHLGQPVRLQRHDPAVVGHRAAFVEPPLHDAAAGARQLSVLVCVQPDRRRFSRTGSTCPATPASPATIRIP